MAVHAVRSFGALLPTHGSAAPGFFARAGILAHPGTGSGAQRIRLGVQLGRRFRALKLWMIIRYFGREGLAGRIREHCRLAKLFASWVEQSPDWEVMAPVPFALVCFRACPRFEAETEEGGTKQLDALNEGIMHGVNATGEAFLSHTKLNDKLTLRLSIGNIRTAERHISRVWDLLNEQLKRLTK